MAGGKSRLSAFELVIHPDVHVHLADILMRYLCRLQVDEAEAFEDIVVEDEVDVVVLLFGMDMLLASDEGKALAEFHQELLQVGNNCPFEGILIEFAARFQAEEFGHDGILNKLESVGDLRGSGDFQHLFFHKFFVLGSQEAVIILGIDVALEGSDAPGLGRSFLHIPVADLGIFDLQQYAVVSP